jgi:predicted dehydrogenase
MEMVTMRKTSGGPYRAGVIGCGAIGSSIADDIADASLRMGLPYGHAPVYRAVSRTTLVAGADPDAARRRAFAARWQLPAEQVYADYREMLAREQLDIVSIACPTPLHAEIALATAEAGVRAIFLEKPVASNLADADRVVAACRAANIPLMVNHTRRGDPLYRRARQLIDDGVIGELHSIVAHFNGHLMWTGTHAFDLLNYFNGDRPAVWMSGHLDEPAGFDPGGSAYIVYENGVRAFVNGSTGNAILFRVHAIGSAGEIVIGNYDLELWRSNKENERQELIRHPFPQVVPAVSPMVALTEELVDALEGGPPPMSNGETGTWALELIVGLHASSQAGGRRIALPIADRSLTIPSL